MSHAATARMVLKDKAAKIVAELLEEKGRDHRFHIDTATRVTLERHGDLIRQLRHKADWTYVRDIIIEVIKDRDSVYLSARMAVGGKEQLSFPDLPAGTVDLVPPVITIDAGEIGNLHVHARYAKKRDFRSYLSLLGEQIKADRKTFEAVNTMLAAAEDIDDEDTPLYELIGRVIRDE